MDLPQNSFSKTKNEMNMYKHGIMGTVNSTYHKAYFMCMKTQCLQFIDHLGTLIITENCEMNVDNPFYNASVPVLFKNLVM